MILLYTSHGCASCRKAKEWLKDRNIEFVEKNIFTSLLREKEVKMLLKRTENGTDDLISKRAKIFQEEKIDIDSMSLDELVDFVQKNPSVLKRPIMIDERRFLVGYDSEDIEMFIPRELRQVSEAACNEKCANYPNCGAVRKED